MNRMTMEEALYTTSAVLAEKETSMWKRFKAFLTENIKIVSNELAAMNGHIYMPENFR